MTPHLCCSQSLFWARDRIDSLHAEIVERQSFIRQYAAQLLLQTQQIPIIQQQTRRASQLRREAKYVK